MTSYVFDIIDVYRSQYLAAQNAAHMLVQDRVNYALTY